jgi:hypothetical protein
MYFPLSSKKKQNPPNKTPKKNTHTVYIEFIPITLSFSCLCHSLVFKKKKKKKKKKKAYFLLFKISNYVLKIKYHSKNINVKV